MLNTAFLLFILYTVRRLGKTLNVPFTPHLPCIASWHVPRLYHYLDANAMRWTELLVQFVRAVSATSPGWLRLGLQTVDVLPLFCLTSSHTGAGCRVVRTRDFTVPLFTTFLYAVNAYYAVCCLHTVRPGLIHLSLYRL